MKYITPKIEVLILEAKDVITTSSNHDVENNGNGEGKIIFKASNLFS